MRRTVLIFIYLLQSTLIFAQSKDSSYLIGQVTIQNSGNRPAYPANIIANRSNPTNTLDKGEFKLVFYGLTPGERARITKVTYKNKNWVVANDKDMYTILPRYPLEDTLKLYLCQRKQLEKKESDFVAEAMKTLEKKYSYERDSLKKASNLLENEITALESKYESLKEKIYEIARTYARANFDFFPQKDLEYYKLIRNGEYLQATLIYDTPEKNIDSIDLLITKENQEHTRAIQTLLVSRDEQVNSILKQYEAFKMNFDWTRAEERIKMAYKVDTINYKIISEIAKFYDSQRYFEQAIFWLTKSLAVSSDWYDSTGNVLYLAEMYTGFMEYEYFKNHKRADSLLLYAARLLDNNKTEDTIQIRKAFSNFYNHKSSFFYYAGAYDSARYFTQKDLKLIEEGLKTDPNYWQFYQGMGYHNYGEQFLRSYELGKSHIYSSEHYTKEEKKILLDSARIYLLKAYNVKNKLLKEQKLNSMSRLAYTCNSLAIVYGYMDSLSLQKKYYRKSFSIYSDLFKKASNSYEPFMRMSYHNLLNMYTESFDMKELHNFYSQTRDLRAALFGDTVTYNMFLCMTYSDFLSNQRYDSTADLEKILAQVVKYGRKVTGDDTILVNDYMAIAYYHLAYNYVIRKAFEKAKLYFLIVKELYKNDESESYVILANRYLKLISEKK